MLPSGGTSPWAGRVSLRNLPGTPVYPTATGHSISPFPLLGEGEDKEKAAGHPYLYPPPQVGVEPPFPTDVHLNENRYRSAGLTIPSPDLGDSTLRTPPRAEVTAMHARHWPTRGPGSDSPGDTLA